MNTNTLTHYNVKIRGYKLDSTQVFDERVFSMPSNHAIEVTQNKDFAIQWLLAGRDPTKRARLASEIGRVFVMIDFPKANVVALPIEYEERLVA